MSSAANMFSKPHDRSDLQVAVNNVVLMQISKRGNYLGTVEPSPFLGKDADFWQMVEQLATIDVLHDEAEPVGSLERVRQMLQQTTQPVWTAVILLSKHQPSTLNVAHLTGNVWATGAQLQ